MHLNLRAALLSPRLASLLALVATASAVAQPADDMGLIAALSSCDAGFFRVLAAHPQRLAPQGLLQPRGTSATFAVPDVTHPTDSKVFFNAPLRLHGLEVIGYFDELTPIPGGVAISWGFLVAHSVSETASRLKPSVWDAARLRQEDGYFVRSEVWRHANPEAGWSKEATEPGPPKPGTVERVFMVEPYDGETAYVRAGCSLQGEVSPDMVRQLRPDIPM